MPKEDDYYQSPSFYVPALKILKETSDYSPEKVKK